MIRILAGSLALLLGLHASAQERDPSTLYTEGVAALESGRSERALDLFRAAFQLEPNAERGLALAATLQERGHYSEAIELYDRILASEFGELDTERAAAIDRARGQADQSRAVIQVRVDAEALDVEVDERPMGTVRRGAALTLRVDPGTHRIRGGVEGRFGSPTSIEVGRGEQRDVTLSAPDELRDSETDPVPDDADVNAASDEHAELDSGGERQASQPVAPWVVLGLAAVPTAVGIATGVMFNTRVDRANEAGNHRDAQPHLDDARPLGRAATASFVVAGASALTGLIWGIASRTKRDDRRVHFGVGVVRGTF